MFNKKKPSEIQESIKGFITILEPKNLTEQTSGIITFGREVEVDVDKEIGEMIEIVGAKF